MRARDGRAVLEQASRLTVGKKDRPGLIEFGCQQHIEQAPLADGSHLGNAGDGLGQLSVLRDDAQALGPFRHRHAPVGQELQSPGMLEPGSNALHLDPARRGRCRSVGDAGRRLPG